MWKTGVVMLGLLAGTFGAAECGAAGPLATAAVGTRGTAATSAYDGVVEAVRQTVVAAQVAGAVVALEVKAGDTVKAGQLLARIDARTADQNASAAQAQVRSAQAMLEVASKEFDRQKQLYDKQYISLAALERAESSYKATQAQAAAQLAQAGAAQTQTALHTVRAPYAGVVAEVPVALGDMAMPGRTLLTLYEPSALRVSAAVPQSALPASLQDLKIEFPGLAGERRWITPAAGQVQLLPTVDAQTHTVTLRVALPAGTVGVAPGLFARVWLPLGQGSAARLFVPASAVVRRAEMTGVYVVDAKGVAVLRQVRLGRVSGDTVEVLSGVSAGENVALDPQAAARAL